MSLAVQLCNNNSPVNKIGKDIITGSSFDCVLKAGTSVLKPIIIIKTSENIYQYNYMYISGFGRYYFIDDIVSVNNNIWEVHGHVDVLQTYMQPILSNDVIIEGTENKAINKYLAGPDAFVVNCKHKTDIVNFPYGFLDTGEFILITAGG